MQLACQCQRIEQALKEANCSKMVQDRIAERATRRNNGNNGSNRQPIVNSPAAAPASANSNSTSTRMARISQPRAQLAAPPIAPVRSTTTNTMTNSPATPRLSTEEMDRLMKFGRCFNCKEEGHAARNCTKPSKPYSAVSAALQEVVEEESEKE